MRGDRRHRVTVQNPDPPVPDGDGGWTQDWHDLDPAQLWVAIRDTLVQSVEQSRSGAVIGLATRTLESAFHPDVTTQTRILHDGTICACGTPDAVYSVLSVTSDAARRVQMTLQVAEVVP